MQLDECAVLAQNRRSDLCRPPFKRLHQPVDVRPNDDLIAIDRDDFFRLLAHRR